MPDDYTPTIPARVRTIAYVVGLVLATLVLLATGLAPIWFAEEMATKVRETAGVIAAAAAFVSSALGVSYRPTR